MAEKIRKLEVRGRGAKAKKREVVIEYRRKRAASEELPVIKLEKEKE